MDLKPPTPRGPGPQAPLVDPTPPPVAEDPFKPDVPPAPVASSGKVKKSGGHKGLKVLLIVVLILGLFGAVGYGTFYWQHQHVDRLIAQRGELQKQIADQQAHMTEMEAENAKLTKEVAVTPTTDELVITATTDYCQAAVDPTTAKALVYTQGTSGTAKKKVLYSADKKFATVTAVCAPTANAKDPSKTYYLKYSGKDWVVLYAGTAADATATKLYNIPTKFE